MNLITRSTLFCLSVGLFLFACEDINVAPNIRPSAEIHVGVLNQAQMPLEGAVVYLFPFESNYLQYLQENPEGNDQITPALSAENVAVSDSAGVAFFPARPLPGNSYASGEIWYHRPNPIYIRAQAIQISQGDTTWLTNDQGFNKITFEELESGDFVIEEVDIVVK